MYKPDNYLIKNRLATSVAVVLLASAMNSQALQFSFVDDAVHVDWDTSLSYGVQYRVQGASPNTGDLAKSWNTNDGTYNFDTGIVSNKFVIVSEADIRWRNLGFFIRGKALYDYRYMNQDTDQSAYTYLYDNSGTGGNAAAAGYTILPLVGTMGTLPPGDFLDDTKDIHGQDAFLLDTFLYGDFSIGGKFLTARVGRQVISWGESFFFPGVSGAQSHPDAAAAAAPGTQVKEIFMPVGALYGNLELSSSFSMEAYFQYEWMPVKQAGVGSYWSNSDVSGAGAERFILFNEVGDGGLVIPVPVIDSVEPSGSDEYQWGVALRWFLESGTEIGFYGLRYNDKYPSVQGVADPTATGQQARLPIGVRDFYNQDQDMYAVSFSTLMGDINIVGELSYSPNSMPTQQTVQPIVGPDGVASTPELQTAFVTQANLGLFYIWGKNFISDSINLIGEASYIRSNLDKDDLAPGQLLNDQHAWGAAVNMNFVYKSVMSGLDLTVLSSLKYTENDWKDRTMNHDAKEAGLGLSGKYLGNWQADLRYATFWGNTDNNTKHDRDNVSFSVKYTF